MDVIEYIVDLQPYVVETIEFDLSDVKLVSMPPNITQVEVTPSTEKQVLKPNSGFFINEVTVNPVTADIDPDIKPENIKVGTTILGVEGNLQFEDKPKQTKTVTPTEEEQSVTADEGYELEETKVLPIPSDYIGSAVTRKTGSTITPTTEEVLAVGKNTYVEGDIRVGAIQTEQTTIKTNGTHTPSAGKFFDKVVVEVADIPAVLQEKSVTPTREPQTVLPDTNYEGMSKVEVGGIPAEFIVPSGSITATENNKTYNVTEVKEVVVAVPEKEDAKLIEGQATQNGEYWAKDYGADGFEVFTVNVEEKYKEPEGSMLIEENGDYDVKDLAEVQVRVPEKEDLDAELKAQDEALTELEDAVNNLPDKSEGTGGVAVNVVGAWTINPDGSANTTNGMYYNFTTDGKVQAIVNGDVTEMGTYTIEDNKIHLTAEGEEMTWYYNEDGGIAVEENADSIMWRLVPSGTLEVKENGDYDVTAKTKVSVAIEAQEPILQDKEVTPTKETQIVMADEGYDGLNSTTILPIPDEFIIPEGELEIKENKIYDVTNKKTVIVNVPTSGGGSGERDENETMYEMQEADYMRYIQGQISMYDIPSEAEYLEQQEYVNSAIAIIMGEEF